MGEYEATVSVVWNGDHYVGSLSITLYKCNKSTTSKKQGVMSSKQKQMLLRGPLLPWVRVPPMARRPRVYIVITLPKYFKDALQNKPKF